MSVTWTIDGQPVSASSCAGELETLTLQLTDAAGTGTYGTSVPCTDGAFAGSKVPNNLQTVTIYGDGELLGSAALANGSAAVNLVP